MPTTPKKRCICDKNSLLKKITGSPELLDCTEINEIRLSLFTQRNSDGTGYLVLRGRDIFEKYNRRISDVDVRAICVYLRKSPRRITKLDLSYNNITDAGFFKLLKNLLIKGRSSITYLNIMNNDITEVSLESLMKNAKLIKLKHLRLNGNKFGRKGGEYLARFLMENDLLEYCDVGDTGFTLTSVAPVMAALRCDYGGNRSVKGLDLSRMIPEFNRYPYESKWLAYHIQLLLERSSAITELHLQKNELTGHDMEYFVRGLSNNKTLLHLDLGYNKIGDYGAELLAKYLSGKPQLKQLNVAGNGIHDLGATALSYGLPCSKIKALNISNNKITDDGLLDILNTIKKPYVMKDFNIWGNEIGPKSCAVLKRMISIGVLDQNSIDLKIFKVDHGLHAAYFRNAADRSRHLYYSELDFGFSQPIYHIKRNEL